jgi:hypothetical protein
MPLRPSRSDVLPLSYHQRGGNFQDRPLLPWEQNGLHASPMRQSKGRERSMLPASGWDLGNTTDNERGRRMSTSERTRQRLRQERQERQARMDALKAQRSRMAVLGEAREEAVLVQQPPDPLPPPHASSAFLPPITKGTGHNDYRHVKSGQLAHNGIALLRAAAD